MIRAIRILGQSEVGPEPYPGAEIPTQPVPGSLEAQTQTQVALDEEARRKRLRTVGGIALLGVVVVGAGALLFLTKEPGSVRYRRALKYGQRRCIGHVRYAVLSQGRLRKVGKC